MRRFAPARRPQAERLRSMLGDIGIMDTPWEETTTVAHRYHATEIRLADPKYSIEVMITDPEPPQGAKARRSPQGMAGPCQGAATPYWSLEVAPAGPNDKRPSGVLRTLPLARTSGARARLPTDRSSFGWIRNCHLDGVPTRGSGAGDRPARECAPAPPPGWLMGGKPL